MAKTEQLISLAQQIADERPRFFETKGPGKGDKFSNSFMGELHTRAQRVFGGSSPQQKIRSEKTNSEADKTVDVLAVGQRPPYDYGDLGQLLEESNQS